MPKQETLLNQDYSPVTLKEGIGRDKADLLKRTHLLLEKETKPLMLCYIHPGSSFQAPAVLSSDFKTIAYARGI